MRFEMWSAGSLRELDGLRVPKAQERRREQRAVGRVPTTERDLQLRPHIIAAAVLRRSHSASSSSTSSSSDASAGLAACAGLEAVAGAASFTGEPQPSPRASGRV